MSDSYNETMDHKMKVQQLMFIVVQILLEQAIKHDNSKLFSPEKEVFDKYADRLEDVTYGSKEYQDFLKEELHMALEHHYKENRHHPDHFSGGIKDMDLFDICEMIIDWLASSYKHRDGNIFRSIEVGQERFGYSDELKSIFINTINRLGGYL